MCHIVSPLIRACQVPVEPLTREDMKHLLGYFVEDRIVRGKQRKKAMSCDGSGSWNQFSAPDAARISEVRHFEAPIRVFACLRPETLHARFVGL